MSLLKQSLFESLTKEILEDKDSFSCKSEEITDFFNNKAINYNEELLGRSYCFILEKDILCAFTVSNTSLLVGNIPKKIRNKINRSIPHEKQRNQYPAVLIGEFAINKKFCGSKNGSFLSDDLMCFIKGWFTVENKTGCRFVLVDALNNEKVLDFYKRNQFLFLFSSEKEEIKMENKSSFIRNFIPKNFFFTKKKLSTRLMAFDLLQINSIKRQTTT
jgi:hypothetical protein